MTLGKIIKQYREDRGMSMREFENISGISRGYLSMLEKDENPQSKKSIAPSLNIIKKAAFAMGASVDDILGRMDGENVTLSGENSISVSDEVLLYNQLYTYMCMCEYYYAALNKNNPSIGSYNLILCSLLKLFWGELRDMALLKEV